MFAYFIGMDKAIEIALSWFLESFCDRVIREKEHLCEQGTRDPSPIWKNMGWETWKEDGTTPSAPNSY